MIAKQVNYRGNSTFFHRRKSDSSVCKKEKDNIIYAAFIDYGMCDIDALKPYDGTSIDAIRFGFTKKNYDEEYDEVVRWAKSNQGKRIQALCSRS